MSKRRGRYDRTRQVTGAGSVEELRNDLTAECRWWNSLSEAERLAYVHGARGADEYAAGDWLDIGETNRVRILDAAFAVECWKDNETGSSAY